MSTPSCQTCYSTIRPAQLPGAYLTPCCGLPICDRCLGVNPRLREYDPCLRCGDVRSASGSSKVRIGAAAQRAEDRRREDERVEAGQFSIGDDDSDEEQEAAVSKPPSYKEGQPMTNGDQEGDQAGGKEAEVDMEVVEVTHPVGRGDTVMSVARKYAADPHDLLTLNSLPPAALSSNPRLLQTRRTLIISRRLIPRGSAPPPPSSSPGLSPEEKEKREAERRLKRFQLITKTTDVGVGRAYLALAEGEDDRHVLESGSGEVLEKEGGGSGKKVRKQEGKEGRALEKYFEDEEWEGEAGRAERVKEGNRWVVVGRGVGMKA